MIPRRMLAVAVLAAVSSPVIQFPAAAAFQLPTDNHALFEKGKEEKFFAGTTGQPWTSGTFGCVRSDGRQIHEGLDIRCLKRDRHGEPLDPVMATADGTVAYVNTKPSLSNYGKYIVLRHRIDGIEIYSTYAHLSELRPGVKSGQSVQAGETIATMGRTANTREGISKDRAHLHLELNLFINDRFAGWYRKTFPGQRNDHGAWNGQNLVAVDPRPILIESHAQGEKFNLLRLIQNQTELCRVQVRATEFPWLNRYGVLVKANSRTKGERVAGYEIAMNFNAIAFELIPRTPSEMRGREQFVLLSVNEAEQRKNPCRRLVAQRGGRWELTSHGLNALELLTY